MKKLFITMLMILLIPIVAYGSRNSDDVVTASNSALNLYIQDVIGNKTDTSNGTSIMSVNQNILIKVNTNQSVMMGAENKIDVIGAELTNTQDKVDILGAELTNTQDKVDILGAELTNTQDKVDVIGAELTNTQDKVDVLGAELTNTQDKIDVLGSEHTNTQDTVDQILLEVNTNQVVVRTNEVIVRTNQNRLVIIDGVVDQTALEVGTNQVILRTNEVLIRTNQNRLVIIDGVVDQTLLEVNTNQIVVRTNEVIGMTNRNRIVVMDAVVDQTLIEVNTNQVEIRTNDKILRTNRARQVVPGADSAANSYMRDVIGNKTDTHAGDSVYAFVETVIDHIHNQSRVWPTAHAGSNVLSSGTAWASTNVTNGLVPCNTIASPFDIHWLCIEDLSANGVYEIILYNTTAGHVEIGRVRVVKNAAQDGTMNIPFQCPIQAANSCIKVRQINSAGANATVTLSIFYHTY